MGFMDKVKSQATQLAEKAQEGLQQGKGKLDELQQGKKAQGSLQQIGAIVYRERTNRPPAGGATIDELVAELQQMEAAGVDVLQAGSAGMGAPGAPGAGAAPGAPGAPGAGFGGMSSAPPPPPGPPVPPGPPMPAGPS